MKKIIVLALVILSANLVYAKPAITNNDGSFATKELVIGVSSVLLGEERNVSSDLKVVLSGYYPNGCYRDGKNEVLHLAKNMHEVRAYAIVSQGMCIQVLVPYTRGVNLGHLTAGEHRIRFIAGDGTYLEKTVMIKQ